jgi:hypothetical protein
LKTEIPGVGDVGDEPLAVVIGPRIGPALSPVFAGTVLAALGSAAGAGPVEVGGCFEQAAPNPRMNDRIKRRFIFVPVFAEKRDQNRSLRCRRAFATRLYQIGAMFPRHRLAFILRHRRSIGVLEFGKRLQGILGSAGKYHLLVAHLERSVGHYDVFSAHACPGSRRQKAPRRVPSRWE